jgi:hypothetical protein
MRLGGYSSYGHILQDSMSTYWFVAIDLSSTLGTNQNLQIRFFADSSTFSKSALLEADEEDLTWVVNAIFPSPPQDKSPRQLVEGIEEYQIEKKIISQMAKEAMQPGVWCDVSQPIRIFESDKPSNVSLRDAKFGITLWSLDTPLSVVD